jgi:hypothetical protein
MTCTICTKYGKWGVTGNLKKLAVEVEHEIEREFIWIKCIEWIKMLHLKGKLHKKNIFLYVFPDL